jgi:hypothetical protein
METQLIRANGSVVKGIEMYAFEYSSDKYYRSHYIRFGAGRDWLVSKSVGSWDKCFATFGAAVAWIDSVTR